MAAKPSSSWNTYTNLINPLLGYIWRVFLRWFTPFWIPRQFSDPCLTCKIEMKLDSNFSRDYIQTNAQQTECKIIDCKKWDAKLTNLPRAIKKCIPVISSGDVRKHRLLETTESSWLRWSRACMADTTKLTFELWNKSLGIFIMLLTADSCPETWYSNLHMKLIQPATDVFSSDRTLEAKVLTADRTKSLFPSCHNENAYICRPLESSRPKTLRWQQV